MATSFENFVNEELPKRIATNESPTSPQAGDLPAFTGVGLLIEAKTPSELGLAKTADLGSAASANTEDFDPAGSASTAQSNAQSYADSLITSVYKVQGSYNPQTTGNFPTSANTVGSIPIKQAFIWVVSGVSGQYTFQGVTVNNGDTIVALIDNPSATTSADWHITESNLGYTPESLNNKDTDGTLAANSDTKYPSQKAVKAYADTKQAALADVITAGTYGSSTQVPVITFNAKGIATTVTLATIGAPVLTEANFSVAKTGKPTYTVSWVLTALTAARAWTVPDTNLDFGNIEKIPAVATPYTTAPMAGTRPQCVGGRGNTFSGGTDVVAVGCTNSTFTGSNIVAYRCNGLVLSNSNVLNSTLSLRNNYVLGTDNVSPITFGLAGYVVEGVTLEGWANYSTFRAWGKGYKVVGYKQYADTNAHGTGYITRTNASTTEATVALFATTVGNAVGTLTLVDEYRLPVTAPSFSQQTAVYELTLQGYDIVNGRKFIGSRRIVVTEVGGTVTVHPLQTIGTDIIVGAAFTVTIAATEGGLAGQVQNWQQGLAITVSNSLTTGATYWTATLKTTLFATAVATNF